VREADFHQRTLGYNVTARRELSRWMRLSLGVQSKHVSTTQAEVLPRYTTRLLNLDWAEDRRDNLFDPQRGRLVQGVAEYAGGILAGTNRFARFTATWQGYSRPQRGWVLAGRVRLGGIEPIGEGPRTEGATETTRLERIPWEERFRLGGGNTIRGYNEGFIGARDTVDVAGGRENVAVGGLSMVLVNLEIRFPIVSIVSGGMFVDAGNVWSHPAEIKLSRLGDGLREREFNPLNVAFGMGLGLRVTTPVGPFRFDYGFKVGSGRAPGDPPGVLHVALGQAF
jgi:outer membrane protein insertion porin family